MYLIPDDIQMNYSVNYSYNGSFKKDGEEPPSRSISQNKSEESLHKDSDDGSSSNS